MPLIWPNPDREGAGLYDGDVLTPDPDREGVALFAGRVAGVDGTNSFGPIVTVKRLGPA